MSTPGSSYPALRCRYAGQLNSTPPGDGRELTASSNLSVVLERVDLQTGKAIWSIPIGDARSLAVDNSGIAMVHLDDHRILVNGQVVDLDSGTVRAPAAGETFWCPARQYFRQAVLGYERGLGRLDRTAGGEVYECDAQANPVSTTPTDVPLAVSVMTATDYGWCQPRRVSSPTACRPDRVAVAIRRHFVVSRAGGRQPRRWQQPRSSGPAQSLAWNHSVATVTWSSTSRIGSTPRPGPAGTWI